MTSRTIILSDIHMGPGGPLSVFEDEIALAHFIGGLADDAIPTELILAGDVFDFLQSPDYQGFDPHRASERFAAIVRNNGDVFGALRKFAATPKNEITLLAGNHDPEVLLPSVRTAFEGIINRRGLVRYDEAVSTDSSGRRLWGRAICNGVVLVVHGDRGDSHNDIDRDQVLRDGKTKLPPGSNLVFQVLAKLQLKHPWVYELKPELETVIPLLLYLDKKHTLRFLKEHFGLTLVMLRNLISSKITSDPNLRTTAKQATVTDVTGQLVLALAEGLEDVPPMQADIFLARFDHWSGGSTGPEHGRSTLAPHDGVGRWLLRSWLSRVRNNERFLAEDGPDELYLRLRPLLPPQVEVLVAGHTHGPRAFAAKTPAYFNSGTWIPIGQLPPGPIEKVIDDLEAGLPWVRIVPRTYVEVNNLDRRVMLRRCDATGTPI